MTDKERIKAEIERRMACFKNERNTLLKASDNNLSLGARIAMCEEIIVFIDSMQEESISDIDFEQELYKAFGQVKDLTLGMQIAKRFYEMGKNNQEPVSEDLEEAAWLQYDKNKPLIPPELDLHKEFIDFFKAGVRWQKSKDESITDDLEEAAHKYADLRMSNYETAFYAFMSGANWQKEQFEKERLKHCDELTEEQAQIESDFVVQHLKENNRTPTFIDAIEYGMRLQKTKMVADAIDVEVKVDAGDYPYIPQMELYDYDKDVPLAKEGDKYKVVLIKEE